MADQYVALPLNETAYPIQANRSRKFFVLFSAIIGLSCVAVYNFDKVNLRVAKIEAAVSIAVQPMKQVIQPSRNGMPMHRPQATNFMQPASRAVFNEEEGSMLGPNHNRRAILAGLAVLPIFTVVEQAKAYELKASRFRPYFNYAGDLAVTGKVDVKGDGCQESIYMQKASDCVNGQILSWELSGVDPKCKDGPGDKPNSCGVHVHKGTSCKEDALGHYFKSKEDPWKTITYTAKQSSSSGPWEAASTNVKVTTELPNSEIQKRTFIVHDFEGARVACGILN